MNSHRNDHLSALRGEILYGDTFSPEEIRVWYEDEREGYADLGAKSKETYEYSYHALNYWHGFRHLRSVPKFEHVLGLGSAYGHELLPVADRSSRITIIEPSVQLRAETLKGKHLTYIDPQPSGILKLQDSSVDLICCFGVLHHIPNVTFIIGEMARCLREGGHLLLREPIVSMGDWRHVRPGLTKHERGIPNHILHLTLARYGISVQHESKCMFPLTRRVGATLRTSAFNSKTLVLIDQFMSRAFAWNRTYHATKAFLKVRPTSTFIVGKKRG